MANEEATSLPKPQDGEEIPAGVIRVIIADSEPIFRVGVRKIIAIEDDVRIVAQVETEAATIAAGSRYAADVLLFEYSLSDTPAEVVTSLLNANPSLKIILVMSQPTEEETVELLRAGVRGIVTRSIAPDLLIKCIRKVYAGETWLDNQGVNWVIEAYRAQAAQLTSPRARIKLSPKEIQIISGVTQGLRNKDIAQEVGTTEQVVKNYLRKVYDKLGVSDRLELALYCMHHRLLESYPKTDEATAAPSIIIRNAPVPVAEAAAARKP
jgi:DNA-binding NarL/FixJ family response regulator